MNAIFKINVADATGYEAHIQHCGTKGSKTLRRENMIHKESYIILRKADAAN